MNFESLDTHPLVNAVERFPDQPALVSEGTSLSYAELFQQAMNLNAGMTAQGLEQGDVIALDTLSAKEIIIAFWACSLGNYIAFPLNSRFPESTLISLIRQARVKLLISQRILISDLIFSMHELTNQDSTEAAALESFNAHRAASLLMTSGSSGSLKLVQHSLANHMASAIGSNLNIALNPTDSWLLSLQIYHVGGLSILFRTALAGASIIIAPDQSTLTHCIVELKPSHVSLVATQFQRILEAGGAEKSLQEMKAILLGGSAIPTHLIEVALDLKLPIHVSYGSTEMASQICTTDAGDRSRALKNSGRLLKGRNLIISHEGEILVKGDTLASGYLEDSGLKDFRDNQGWFHTGDVGYLDVNGALTVTGRLDNQFISGGENIQPEQIELTLANIPGITQAFIVPRSDPEYGQRPVAFLELDNPDLSQELITNILRKTLPGFMIPTDFYLLPPDLLQHRLKVSRKQLLNLVNDPNNHLHPLV